MDDLQKNVATDRPLCKKPAHSYKSLSFAKLKNGYTGPLSCRSIWICKKYPKLQNIPFKVSTFSRTCGAYGGEEKLVTVL